jgi:hypothetical protein
MQAIQIRFIFFSLVLAEALLHSACGGSGTMTSGGSVVTTDPARPTALTLASGESMSRAYVLIGL